ncbi:MAG: response regulator [Pontibacterium sp.]
MAEVNYSDKRVLLVDSSGNMRSAIFHMLRTMGITNVRAITISRRVLSEISEGNYDIILLGHNVSDAVAGIQLLEEARFRGYMKPSASWVFMTSDASQETVLHAIDSQPDVLITKPFTVDELKHRLDALMIRRETFRAVDAALEAGDTEAAIRISLTQFPAGSRNHDEAGMLACKLLLKIKRYDQVLMLAESLYRRTHDKGAGLYWAEALIARDRMAEAKELIQEIIETNPLYIAAYDLLALAHERSGEPDAARDIVQMATMKSPMGIPRQMTLGRLATQTRQLNIAESAYKRSISLGHKSCYRSPEPYLRLANVHRLELSQENTQKNFELERGFEELLSQAAAQFRNDPGLKVRAALLRSEMASALERPDDVKKFLRDARRENAALATPLDMRSELELLSGAPPAKVPAEPGSAAATKKEMAKRDPDMSQKVNRQGVKHYSNGRLSQALRHFGLALEYDYANLQALLNLAQMYLELARDDEGKREERLRMFDRNMHLAGKLNPEGDGKRKQQALVRLREKKIEDLPEGPLGGLLR